MGAFHCSLTMTQSIPIIRYSAMPSKNIPSPLAGVAGEYFVAAELSSRGYIASISLRNTRGIDILATNQSGSRSVTIQCKTNQRAKPLWVLNQKSEDFFSDSHFYVLVSLGVPGERPRFHVVPSKTVAEWTKTSHRKWLETPGRKGQQHADNKVRTFQDLENAYLERWDILKLE
jgi:hypothetical protein